MKTLLKTLLAAVGLTIAAQAPAQVIFYEYAEYEGRTFSTDEQVRDFNRIGFNNRASSIVVLHDPWEVCEDSRFGGRCATLRPGNYPSLAKMGLNDRISSARPQIPIERSHYRRGDDEQLYEADVTSVYAVLANAEKQCWIEREQVTQEPRANVPGAIVGAIIGGILGHQVGGGSGKKLATAGGVVVGAAVGSKTGQDSNGVTTQDIQRCSTTPANSRPEYWDVSYRFQGVDHHVQMRSPPGATIVVNSRGEPRE